jgi:peptidoglycan/LPS O-acetylase OafA/YrhL
MPASPPRSLLLDNWRGWAILLVLSGHFLQQGGDSLGRLGVELFFVLSGRLMADLLFVKNVGLRTFFYRRFSRVIPGSLLFIGSAFLIFSSGVDELGKRAALASAAMVINYSQLVGIGSAVTGHYWSLCVEEHSYIALALIAWTLRRTARQSLARPATICLALATLMVFNGWRLWHHEPFYYSVYWRSDVRAATIFMSAGLRLLQVSRPRGFLRAPWIAVAALLAALACSSALAPDPVKYSLGSLLIALSINTLEDTYAWARGLLSSRIVGWLGIVSYSVYIWQQPFYNHVDIYHGLPMLAGAIATGAAIFYWYEEPVREWLNTRRARRPDLAPVQ